MSATTFSYRPGLGTPRSLVTEALITSLTLVIVCLVLVWGPRTRVGANSADAGRQLQQQLSRLVQEQTSQLQEAVGTAGDAALLDTSDLSFTHLFVVDVERNVALSGLRTFSGNHVYKNFENQLHSRLEALAQSRSLTMRGALDLGPAEAAAPAAQVVAGDGALIAAGDSGYAASIALLAPLPNGVARHLMAVVGLRRIDATWMARLAATDAVASLAVVPAPSGDPSVYAMAINGAAKPVWLEWRFDDTREHFVANIGAWVVSFAVLLAAFIAWRTTKGLAANELAAKRLAGHDLLSGLPNRLLFTDILESELENLQHTGGNLALFYIDLDRFKEINDSFGHEAGDRLIVAVARRMQETLRLTDTVARFGGDEFAILQPHVKSLADAEHLARRVLGALREPFDIGQNQVRIGASIGVAVGPIDATNAEDILKCADLALYRAKASGRNRYMLFQKSMVIQNEQRKATEQELRLAIERNELVVYYQPIVSIDGTKLVAVEALVRWMHPERGMIPPGEFIALAESRGLILPLGEFVLRQACHDARHFAGIRVAVNVSAIQFRHRNFVQTVERALAESGLEPARLELELTEGVVVEDADEAENAMIELRAMGVRLALDDFGTGYSSLIYLRRFAFDKIKIDRSFLESVESTGESAIIVHSVVHLGRALGLTVTAEGIETREQHRFLQALGAHELQGYMFARPSPASVIIDICNNNCVMPPPKPIDPDTDSEEADAAANVAVESTAPPLTSAA